jgi:hypothetical protein
MCLAEIWRYNLITKLEMYEKMPAPSTTLLAKCLLKRYLKNSPKLEIVARITHRTGAVEWLVYSREKILADFYYLF